MNSPVVTQYLPLAAKKALLTALNLQGGAELGIMRI